MSRGDGYWSGAGWVVANASGDPLLNQGRSPLACFLNKAWIVDVKAPTVPSRRMVEWILVAASTLLGLTWLVEAEPARNVGFLFHYAARLGQDALAFFRAS